MQGMSIFVLQKMSNHPILNVPSTLSKAKRAECLGPASCCWAYVGNHHCFTVAAKGVLSITTNLHVLRKLQLLIFICCVASLATP